MHDARAPTMTSLPCWTFLMPTPLGITKSTYELADDGLHFTTDDVMSASERLPWASIHQGCTAAMAGMSGRGGPDLPNWVPAQLEWLLLSRRAGGGKAFMRPLPQGVDRDALVAAIQARLGSGWVGDRLAIRDAQQQLGITEGSQLKAWGIILAAMALLFLSVIALALLIHPLILIPASILVGAWLCRRGLAGLRDGLAVANTPTAKAGSAALGLVELEGHAFATDTSAAAITGRPSVWWDVAICLWYEEDDEGGGRTGHWRQVAARHGGKIDLIEIEDATGRLPVWLPGATLVLGSTEWESGKDDLPAAGTALLDELGFAWNDGRRKRVTEQCLEPGQTLYVIGTLDERRNLREPSEAGLLERAEHSVRSGQWRRALVGAVPAPLRIVVAAVIGYFDMFTKIGHGGERAQRDIVAAPPVMAPNAMVVWKGRLGHPFVVSNQPERSALASLRTISLWTFGTGGAALCFALYQIVELFTGG